MSLVVLDASGIGDVAAAIEAIDYAVAHGAQVLNMSWGTGENSRLLADAIRRASRSEVVAVCPAGNGGRDIDAVPYYPAAFKLPNIISVGATDANDNPAPFSNYGMRTVSISAPGVNLLTATMGGTNTYVSVSGTSAAAALVSGIVGLLKTLSFAISPEQVNRILLHGARPVSSLYGKNQAGGVVSGNGAFAAANDGTLGTSQNQQTNDPSSAPTVRGVSGESIGVNSSVAANSGSTTRSIRRRATAGPGLPDLDVQKNAVPAIPETPRAVASRKRNCSPWIPDCERRRVPHPPGFSAIHMDQSKFVASSWFGRYRQLVSLLNNAKLPGTKTTAELVLSNEPYPERFLLPENDAATIPLLTNPTVDEFVTNFHQGSLSRNPASNELAFWKDQLKDATSLGSSSVLAAAKYLGNALFLSKEYADRNRTTSQYVTDLYWGYLQHAPDSNQSAWESAVGTYGREAVRLEFANSTEFTTLVGTINVGTYPTSSGNFSTARTDIVNRTGTGGEDLLSGNINFSISILSLPGRVLDLGLSLTYNSRVWSKVGSTIAFDTDRGYPAPGFRLGFPVVQQRFYNSATGTASYLLITPDGAHVELRRVGTSSIYESADSNYIQLTDNGSSLILKTTAGTKMTYALASDQWMCTEIKDRNGNYISVNYSAAGNVTSVVDTLGRTITFNYDSNSHLQTITQTWGTSTPHTWASFSYDNTTIDTDFSSVYMLWPQDGLSISVLTQVGFADGSHINFEYNPYGQVNKVKRYASNNSLQSQVRYTFDTPSGDCPRITHRYEWARYWNGDTNGSVATGEETDTQFTTGLSGGVMTTPDSTVYKEFYGSSGYQRGLTTSTEVWTGSTNQKWTTTNWTQDNTSVSYPLNPRVTETNIYDAAFNRRRTTIDYTSYSLPSTVTEYAANASTIYRKTVMEYVTSSTYINNRIIGLVSKVEIKDASDVLQSKTEFTYDSSGEHFSTVTGKTHHDDTNYGSTLVTGRGNLTIATRHDVSISGTTQNKVGYNSLGQVMFTRDASSHQTNISYSENFSDSNNSRNTHAYATLVQDPDGYNYATQYNFDFGGITRTEDPKGAVVTTAYDSVGRVDSIINVASSTNSSLQARTRYVYGADYLGTYVRGFDGANEGYTNTQFDGAGRVRAVASENPSSGTQSGGAYRMIYTDYNAMGRVNEQTNPTEVSSSWAAAGDDATSGFISFAQTYDWKGRPLVSINQDNTERTISYSGCGCAGGEVVTTLDEVGRQQKIYSDVFGREIKKEVYSNASTVNSTIVTSYNLLDQVTLLRQYAGTDSSSTYQDTTMQYDGYGRLWKTHKPEFDANTYNTFSYNSDDTIAAVTDPRGVTATYTFNARHLLTQSSYSAPSGLQATVPATPTATFTYDSAGNRLTMSSSVSSVEYNYDTASRLTSETRTFGGLTGQFTLTYGYNPAGALTSLQDAFSATVSYSYDRVGQLTGAGASGSGFPSLSSFINNAQYRAWGAAKSVFYNSAVSESTAFNSRLQPASYTLAWTGTSYSFASTFDYYDDGRANHAYGFSPSFDRKWDYDFVGRVKDAYTNREARGLVPTSPSIDPYRQTVTYDAFGNQTSRSGKLYSHTMGTDADSYIKNRRAAFEYDAAGNVTNGGGLHQFDEAGSHVRGITHVLSTGDDYYHEVTTTITMNKDGDGNSAKRTQYTNRWDGVGEDPITQSEETIITYNLRSTVIGAVIDELDSDGVKIRGHIYAGGRKIAEQEVTPSTNEINLHLTSPVSGTIAQPPITGYFNFPTIEFDPAGAEVPQWDPYNLVEAPIYHDIVQEPERLYVIGGDPFDYTGGCELDGVPLPCSSFSRLIEADAVDRIWTDRWVQDPNAPYDGPSRYRRRPRREPVIDKGLGIYLIWMDSEFTQDAKSKSGNVIYAVPFDYQRIHDLLRQTVTKAACSTFIRRILGSVSSKDNPLVERGDLEKLFFSVLNQKQKGFTRIPIPGGAGFGSAKGQIKPGGRGNAEIYLPASKDTSIRNWLDTLGAIGELMHLAGRNTYSDYELAVAVNKIPEYAAAFRGFPQSNPFNASYAGNAKDKNSGGYSSYFHGVLREICQVPQED